MKKLFVFSLALILSFGSLKADEGMWIPMLVERLNYVDMQEMGLQLTAEEIYSINNSSLKDAIVIFGGGCTGEVISSKGLILTNHHCGYGSIQRVSTTEANYLKDGFWAESFDQEIPISGLRVQFLHQITDVTKDVLEGVNDEMTEKERGEVVSKNIKAITEEAKKDSEYSVSVRSFYHGNEFYMFEYLVYTDVRLAGTPPESIGKFGADTDNWMWPRHTGDFSLFRVYGDADGKPAKYSEDNVPLVPKHHLPISITGVEKGDFTMIMGYPGGTDRYLTSFGVKLAVDVSNMTVVKIREEILRLMMQEMEKDDAVRLQYSSKYARKANYWKYFIGQTKGLKRLKVYEKKQAIEADYSKWLASNGDMDKKYGQALPLIEDAYKTIEKYQLSNTYFMEGIYRGPEILGLSYRYRNLHKLMSDKETEQEEIDKAIAGLKGQLDGFYKDYNATIDQDLLGAMLKMYYENVPSDQQPQHLKDLANKYDGDFDAFAEMVFEKSIFKSKESIIEFLEKPKAKKLAKDPVYQLMDEFIVKYRELMKNTSDAYTNLDKGNRLFMAGLREMKPDHTFYPDANFTMRLTYGTVQDYYPSDAVHYNYYTTTNGILQKEDPNNWEFVVPDKLKELIEAGDFGEYGCGDKMTVCFLTNHDITGGNSGSPVINGRGELVGLAFDGNWEAMSGDIAFEPELQRTINVDIRYVMFIIDKFAGAQNLIDEMTIVKEKPQMKVGLPEVKEEVMEMEMEE